MSSAAGVVDGLGDQIDPRPLLTLQQNTANLFGRLLNLLTQGLHRGAMPDHIAKIAVTELSLQSSILGMQPGSLAGTGQHSRKDRW